jgi:hypothetical protein
MEEIKSAIAGFVKGGDNTDTMLLEKILHPDFQNIQDGYFDQKGIYIFDKNQYIELVQTKKFGGHPRSIDYTSIKQLGNIAIANLVLETQQLKFISTIVCVYENNQWQIISNIPVVEPK